MGEEWSHKGSTGKFPISIPFRYDWEVYSTEGDYWVTIISIPFRYDWEDLGRSNHDQGFVISIPFRYDWENGIIRDQPENSRFQFLLGTIGSFN